MSAPTPETNLTNTSLRNDPCLRKCCSHFGSSLAQVWLPVYVCALRSFLQYGDAHRQPFKSMEQNGWKQKGSHKVWNRITIHTAPSRREGQGIRTHGRRRGGACANLSAASGKSKRWNSSRKCDYGWHRHSFETTAWTHHCQHQCFECGCPNVGCKIWRFEDCRGNSPEGNGVAHGCYPSSGGKNGRTSATFTWANDTGGRVDQNPSGGCHARNETGHEGTKCWSKSGQENVDSCDRQFGRHWFPRSSSSMVEGQVDRASTVQVYGKGTFQGMILAEFKDQFDRDLAVTLLRTAGLQHNGKPVWASQDRGPVERAARNFGFGLKKVFKEEWNIPYNVRISEEKPYTMTVGGELALTAHVSPGEVVHEWHGAWANWDELHSSAQVKVLLEKSQALITRMKEGMKGSPKSGPKGHH